MPLGARQKNPARSVVTCNYCGGVRVAGIECSGCKARLFIAKSGLSADDVREIAADTMVSRAISKQMETTMLRTRKANDYGVPTTDDRFEPDRSTLWNEGTEGTSAREAREYSEGSFGASGASVEEMVSTFSDFFPQDNLELGAEDLARAFKREIRRIYERTGDVRKARVTVIDAMGFLIKNELAELAEDGEKAFKPRRHNNQTRWAVRNHDGVPMGDKRAAWDGNSVAQGSIASLLHAMTGGAVAKAGDAMSAFVNKPERQAAIAALTRDDAFVANNVATTLMRCASGVLTDSNDIRMEYKTMLRSAPASVRQCYPELPWQN